MSVFAWLRGLRRPASPPDASRPAGGRSAARRPHSSSDSFDPSPARAEAGAHPFSRRLRRGLAAALLALPLLAGLAAGAQAQTLVSNLGQSNASRHSLGLDHAQPFTTGGDGAGYVLNSVDVQFAGISDPALASKLTASIRTARGTNLSAGWLGQPHRTVGTLTTPAMSVSNADRTYTFTAPGGGIVLARNTVYWLVLDVTGAPTGANYVRRTASSGTDAGAASGWTIGHRHRGVDTRLYRPRDNAQNWWRTTRYLKYRINGAARRFTVSFANDSMDIDEGRGVVKEALVLSQPRERDTWVSLIPTPGTAGAHDYYLARTPRYLIPAGQTRALVSVRAVDDKVFGEVNESFTIAIDAASLPDGVSVGSTGTMTVYVHDNDNIPAFDQASYLVPEDAGHALLPIRFSSHLRQDTPLRFRYTHLHTNRWDFNPVVDVTARKGENEVVLRVPITDDIEFEQQELFRVTWLHDPFDPNAPLPTGLSSEVFTDVIIQDDDTRRGWTGNGRTGRDYFCYGPPIRYVEVTPSDGVTVRIPQEGPQVAPPPTEGVRIEWDGVSGGKATFTISMRNGELPCADVVMNVRLQSRTAAQVAGNYPYVTKGTADHPIPADAETHLIVTLPRGGTEVTTSVPVQAAGEIGVVLMGGNTGPVYAPDGNQAGSYSPGREHWVPVHQTALAQIPTPPVLTLAADAGSATEGDTVSFTITADKAPQADVEVRVSAAERMGAGGDAIAVDHVLPVLLKAGATSVTWSFTAHSDEVERAHGTIEARIEPDRGAHESYKVGDPSFVTMTLLDDDGTQAPPAPVTVSLAAEQTSVAEANGETKWTIALSRALAAGETVTVPYAVSGGEPGYHWSVVFRAADNGPGVTRHGHGKNGSELRFTEGGQVATMVLIGRPTTDAVERTIRVAFGTGGRAPSSTGIAAGIELGTSSFEVDIIDDDGSVPSSLGGTSQPVTVSLAAEQSSIAEANGETKWTIALDRALGAGETVTVPYAVSGGEPGAHWSVVFRAGDNGPGVSRHGHGKHGSELRFTQGGQVATMVLIGRPTTDTVERTIRVSFGTGGRAPSSTGIPGGIALGTSFFEVDIIDDDGTQQQQPPVVEPAVTIAAGTSPVTEGGDAVFTLTATPVPQAPLAVTVAVAADGDYGVTAGDRTVTIPTGGSATLTLSTTDDSTDEPDGSATATVKAGSGYTVGAPASGTVTIRDDDDPPPVIVPAITIAAGTSPVTEGGDAVFTITATPAPSAPLAVTVAVAADGDYGVTGGDRTVTIPTGGSATLALPTTDDSADEPDGSATATVKAGNGYSVGSPASGTVAIRDNDEPGVTIAAGASPITEGGDAVFTLTASPAPHAPLAVTVAVAANGDYGVTGGDRTVTIPTGGSATLTLATTDDTADEPDGSASVTVKAGNGYSVGSPASGSVAIRDDDLPPPVITIAAKVASITEGGDAVFTIAADRAPGSDLPVNIAVSETGGGDHVAAAHEGAVTATIRQGATSVEITVPTVNDTADEPDGAVTATLKGGSGYTLGGASTASVAVADDASSLPALTIGDATAREGEAMTFTVRLSKPSAQTVSLFLATRETVPASARAGADFQQVGEWNPHWMTILPGRTEASWEVATFDDFHDDGGETFEAYIVSAQGAPIADGVAVGTIENDDPLPAAWLKRFGRTVAQQALDGIAARIEAPRAAGMQGTLAGQALDFAPGDGDTAGPGDAAIAIPAAGGDAALAMAGIARGFGADASAPAAAGGAGPFGNGGADPFGSGFGAPQGQSLAMQSRAMTARDALLGSSFSLTGERDGMGGSLAFWGRASQGGFDGTERGDGTDITLDGTVTTGLLGADYARDRWLVGLALAQSSAEGDYAALGGGSPCPEVGGEVPALCDGGVRAGDGGIEASLTAAIPYAALQASERLRLWGAAGYGSGEVTVKTMEESYSADTSWSMAAAGVRGDLLDAPAEGSGPALAVTSDALWARTSSEKTRDLAASESDVTRLRLGLEGSWQMVLDGGGSLVPKLEIGARHDGGDAESGFGVELGGGIAWTDPALGLSLDLSGRTLLSHEDSDFEDRGYSASLAFDPNPATGRGPSLSLRQDWGGQAAGGLDALFAPDPLAERTGSGAGGSEATSRWTMEAAYGLPILGGRFTGSPYAGFGLATGARDYSLGWRLTPEGRGVHDLSFGLKATRMESDSAAPEHTVGVEASVRW